MSVGSGRKRLRDSQVSVCEVMVETESPADRTKPR